MLGKRKRNTSMVPALKEKKNLTAIEEISFDIDAREDYLTGFHKRKLQRIKHAQEEAAKKAKEDKIAARKALRDARKADLEKHVEEVNSMLRKSEDGPTLSESDKSEAEGGKWEGITEAVKVDYEEDYMDEDWHTTVTVEAVDVTKDGLHKTVQDNGEDSTDEGKTDPVTEDKAIDMVANAEAKTKRVWTKERPSGPKKKKKKFKYESKAERKVTRYKERSGNRAKAKARKE